MVFIFFGVGGSGRRPLESADPEGRGVWVNFILPRGWGWGLRVKYDLEMVLLGSARRMAHGSDPTWLDIGNQCNP